MEINKNGSKNRLSEQTPDWTRTLGQSPDRTKTLDFFGIF